MTITELPKVRLPNGVEIVEINPYETKFLYKEIFEDETYLRNGIRLREDALIFDVGANIGLFSLFCLQKAPRAKVFAFEPAPHCVSCMRANIASAGNAIELSEEAIVDVPGPRQFTYYPNYSIMSGVLADPLADSEILRKGATRQLGIDSADRSSRKMVDMLVRSKLKDAVEFTCEGTTISDVMERHGVTRIDLLKVDVEKAETMVLRGIQNADWPKIGQMVIEAHDLGGAEHLQICHLLEGKGFGVAMEMAEALTSSDIYSIYATRAT